MQPTIPSSKRSSGGSGRAFILRPSRSRLLLAWLAGTHLLAAAALLELPLGAFARGVLLVALAAHAYWRRPDRVEPIVCNSNGDWSLPASGLIALRLASATCYGTWWVDLRLRAAGARRRILLCRDQLGAEDWRALQAMLRCGRSAGDLS